MQYVQQQQQYQQQAGQFVQQEGQQLFYQQQMNAQNQQEVMYPHAQQPGQLQQPMQGTPVHQTISTEHTFV